PQSGGHLASRTIHVRLRLTVKFKLHAKSIKTTSVARTQHTARNHGRAA
ncbi:MAG: hypothetical protein ACI9G1_005360, partial [Pirellulaceae bacterium]